MTKKIRSSIKKAWVHLSKQQKITLGTLTFLVVALPLSLLLVKTQTNIFPKATFPATPPITSLVPSPSSSPNPSWAPSPSPVVCTDVAGSCVGMDGRMCLKYTDSCQAESMCRQPIVSCASLPCSTSCWSSSQCAAINPDWTCHFDNPLAETGSCRLASNPESPTCGAVLSNHCESCNPSLPPSTPNSRCVEGLVCKTEDNEVCEIVQGKGKVCTAIIGQSGKCVKPGESIAVCQNSDPISLEGDTLPDNPRIELHNLIVNELPINSSPSDKLINLQQNGLSIDNGIGVFYKILPNILSEEIEIVLIGDENSAQNIKTVLYGPDKKKMLKSNSRVKFIAQSEGPYYLAMYTTYLEETWIQTFTDNTRRKTINPVLTAQNEELLKINLFRLNSDRYGRVGRKPVALTLQTPKLITTRPNFLEYQHISDYGHIILQKKGIVTLEKECPSTGLSLHIKTDLELIPDPSDPNNSVLVHPDGFDYFPAGYIYRINIQHIDENNSPLNTGWAASFSTISNSGNYADLNNDGAVDISDYSLLVSELMQSNNFLVSDLNCDGIVDISDYSLLINNISL